LAELAGGEQLGAGDRATKEKLGRRITRRLERRMKEIKRGLLVPCESCRS
jgi:hypothetical protein